MLGRLQSQLSAKAFRKARAEEIQMLEELTPETETRLSAALRKWQVSPRGSRSSSKGFVVSDLTSGAEGTASELNSPREIQSLRSSAEHLISNQVSFVSVGVNLFC